MAVPVKDRKGNVTHHAEDEGYNRLKLDKVPTLKPAFDRSGSGTVTAANSSSFNDGASALVLANRELAKTYGREKKVLARMCGYADAALDPIDFPVAPAKVVPIALERAGITKDQVKVWEFNEAFAAVIKANAKVIFHLFCSLSSISLRYVNCFNGHFANVVFIYIDTRPRRRQCQPPRRRHCSRPRVGQFWLKNHYDAPASIEEG